MQINTHTRLCRSTHTQDYADKHTHKIMQINIHTRLCRSTHTQDYADQHTHKISTKQKQTKYKRFMYLSTSFNICVYYL